VLKNLLDAVTSLEIYLPVDVQSFAFLSLFYAGHNCRYWKVISTKLNSVELGEGS